MKVSSLIQHATVEQCKEIDALKGERNRWQLLATTLLVRFYKAEDALKVNDIKAVNALIKDGVEVAQEILGGCDE